MHTRRHTNGHRLHFFIWHLLLQSNSEDLTCLCALTFVEILLSLHIMIYCFFKSYWLECDRWFCKFINPLYPLWKYGNYCVQLVLFHVGVRILKLLPWLSQQIQIQKILPGLSIVLLRNQVSRKLSVGRKISFISF